MVDGLLTMGQTRSGAYLPAENIGASQGFDAAETDNVLWIPRGKAMYIPIFPHLPDTRPPAYFG